MVRRNIFRNDATGSHDDSSANRHTGKDNAVSTEPTVLANCNWLTGLRTFGSIADGGIYWVCARVEGAIWADQSPSPDTDQARIDPSATAVDVDIVTKPGMSVFGWTDVEND